MRPFAVVGVGGLGCPALLGLSSSGARRLIVVDADRVEGHNLQRQILFGLADVGRPKVLAAAHRLQARCPTLAIEPRCEAVDPAAALAFLESLPPGVVVLECSDDPELKFALNDACLARGVPLVVGAALRMRGQAMAVRGGTACYRCIYEAPPTDAPTCTAAGILGPAVGAAGAVMAALALGLADDRPDTAGRLIEIDAYTCAIREIAPNSRPACTACRRQGENHGHCANPDPAAQVHAR